MLSASVSFCVTFASAYIVSMLFSDVLHYVLHRCSEAHLPVLRKVGSLHQTHHDFWSSSLEFDNRLAKKNYWHHLFPEYLSAIFGGACLFAIFPKLPVAANLAWLTVLFVRRAFSNGRDSNHRDIATLPPPTTNFLVGLRYHAHHHVFPNCFYGSTVKLIDILLGTATPIRGRRFLLTGSGGALGGPMKRLLEENGATEVETLRYGADFSYDDYSKVGLKMAKADVLILCHGAKGPSAFAANATSFVTLIEMFRKTTRTSRAPREVWAVGSEVECHFSSDKEYYESKRAFARVARAYYWQDEFIYRHIVPSAFTSPMGMGLTSGAVVANVALFLIKRGFRYVPVTYNGVAFLNYLKFFFRWRARAPEQLSFS